MFVGEGGQTACEKFMVKLTKNFPDLALVSKDEKTTTKPTTKPLSRRPTVRVQIDVGEGQLSHNRAGLEGVTLSYDAFGLDHPLDRHKRKHYLPGTCVQAENTNSV